MWATWTNNFGVIALDADDRPFVMASPREGSDGLLIQNLNLDGRPLDGTKGRYWAPRMTIPTM